MDSTKLLEVLDEDELFEIARTAEIKMNRWHVSALENERKDQFIDYLVSELKNYFAEKVDFEPLVLHYMDRSWHDNHSDEAYVLEEVDRRRAH